ncbi:peptidylprolyl isomerase [Lacinutrix sp. C3R15]|uniref:peptidylprolyl isomerase n=1 Tax=Flavobacteriaceae TaxID=49546 RepID=UPI001C09A805|nr:MULTISPECIES: peptidylprolyl isomerase [Flavobacteriaceae]MBU2938412.1 peptidylprolyl isomerase [Lacinutrix sp. C3R15]MDO6621726.1 peptidylprolyl isomerase [Oceanihabitans sp. 1_MG-2023]
MRFVLLCFIPLLFLNCEDKKTEPKKTSKIVQKTSEEKKEAKKDSVIEPEREYPFLTDENAMEFFLEYEKHNKENKVRITTDFGDIDILLFNETKFHRANFIFLTKQGYFNNTQFYRIVNNFIIQGGNTDDAKVKRKRKKIGKYLLPKDTKRGFKHHRGVVSMPSGAIKNPYKLASPYQFFIVQKKDGAYHLDGDYTIFGKVTRGMDVVDEIAKQETDNAEWPLHNVYIKKVEIIE